MNDYRFFFGIDDDDETQFINKARPASYHPGSVIVAFICGRAMFLRETIDYITYIALMAPHEKRLDTPNPDCTLEDHPYL